MYLVSFYISKNLSNTDITHKTKMQMNNFILNYLFPLELPPNPKVIYPILPSFYCKP
jgi:hypothetical protein